MHHNAKVILTALPAALQYITTPKDTKNNNTRMTKDKRARAFRRSNKMGHHRNTQRELQNEFSFIFMHSDEEVEMW